MIYNSENSFPSATRIKDVLEFIGLLNYRRVSRPRLRVAGEIARYYFFEEEDYKSWTVIRLLVHQKKGEALNVLTGTYPGRPSYYDLTHQNYTVRSLSRRFGGTFRTDAGKGRYFPLKSNPPLPQESGCYLAFRRFGNNIFNADLYLMRNQVPNKQWGKGILGLKHATDLSLLSNNLLLPYLVSVLEDYFKSTYIALLRYSQQKKKILTATRLSAQHLAKISSHEMSVEEAFSETLSFQSISQICQHFKALDPKLDLAGVLQKPYRRRTRKLFDEIDALVLRRHQFLHQNSMDTGFTDAEAKKALDDLEVSVVRCYRHITHHYGWVFNKGQFRARGA